MEAFESFAALALESGNHLSRGPDGFLPLAECQNKHGLQYSSFDLGQFGTRKGQPENMIEVFDRDGVNG